MLGGQCGALGGWLGAERVPRVAALGPHRGGVICFGTVGDTRGGHPGANGSEALQSVVGVLGILVFEVTWQAGVFLATMSPHPLACPRRCCLGRRGDLMRARDGGVLCLAPTMLALHGWMDVRDRYDYLMIETSGVTDPDSIIRALDKKFGKLTRARWSSGCRLSSRLLHTGSIAWTHGFLHVFSWDSSGDKFPLRGARGAPFVRPVVTLCLGNAFVLADLCHRFPGTSAFR